LQRVCQREASSIKSEETHRASDILQASQSGPWDQIRLLGATSTHFCHTDGHFGVQDARGVSAAGISTYARCWLPAMRRQRETYDRANQPDCEVTRRAMPFTGLHTPQPSHAVAMQRGTQMVRICGSRDRARQMVSGVHARIATGRRNSSCPSRGHVCEAFSTMSASLAKRTRTGRVQSRLGDRLRTSWPAALCPKSSFPWRSNCLCRPETAGRAKATLLQR
jgi:hypothetical protein